MPRDNTKAYYQEGLFYSKPLKKWLVRVKNGKDKLVSLCARKTEEEALLEYKNYNNEHDVKPTEEQLVSLMEEQIHERFQKKSQTNSIFNINLETK